MFKQCDRNDLPDLGDKSSISWCKWRVEVLSRRTIVITAALPLQPPRRDASSKCQSIDIRDRVRFCPGAGPARLGPARPLLRCCCCCWCVSRGRRIQDVTSIVSDLVYYLSIDNSTSLVDASRCCSHRSTPAESTGLAPTDRRGPVIDDASCLV